MAVQTTYGAQIAAAVPGQIADMRTRTVISRELLSPSLPYGAIVLRGTSDHTCAAVGYSGAGGYLGVSILDPTVRPAIANQNAVGDTVGVIVRGIVWVTVTSNVTPGAAAFYDSSGNITATSTSNTAIPNGVFETTAASGALAQLRL